MNPAGRIKALVEHFTALSHERAQIKGWTRYIENAGGLPGTNVDDAVLLALRSTSLELRALTSRAKQLDIPASLYQPTVEGIAEAFTTAHLHQKWAAVSGYVTGADVRMCLSWLDWALERFNETDMNEADLAALIAAIENQESLLEHTAMPAGLRDLLEGQIAELRTALLLYRIRGIQPLVDAVNKQSGEMRNAPPDLVDEVKAFSPEAQGAVARGMELITKAAKAAESGSKIVKFGKDMFELGASGWQAFGQNLLGP